MGQMVSSRVKVFIAGVVVVIAIGFAWAALLSILTDRNHESAVRVVGTSGAPADAHRAVLAGHAVRLLAPTGWTPDAAVARTGG